MIIEDGIVKDYLQHKPASVYSAHWVYQAVEEGKTCFALFPYERKEEVEACYHQILEVCSHFHLLNKGLIHEIFEGADTAARHTHLLLTVHIPQPYDAMVRTHSGRDYIILDIGNFCEYRKAGIDTVDMVRNFLTHELIHIMINIKYPRGSFTYTDELDYIAFHEGFAHLLSFEEDIRHYRPDDRFAERFEAAKSKLTAALAEKDPVRQAQFLQEADSGKFWEKFAAIASMLFLMKHIDELKKIYSAGWKAYTKWILASQHH